MSRTAKFWMVAALMAVVAGGFRVSWNALRDVARAIGVDPTAATVYPLVVDGLMALALVAALVLQGARSAKDRRFALWVLGGYTVASLVLNYVHGLMPTLHGGGRVRLADWAPAHYALVLLASSLPVGSIFFGSDLVAKVLHYQPEPGESGQNSTKGSVSDLRESPDPQPAEPVPPVAASAPTAVPPVAPVPVVPVPTVPAPTATPLAPVATPKTVRPLKAVAASAGRPRRATGTIAPAARSTQPKRTSEELLAAARVATVGWADDRLTADRIREAVHTSSAKARVLRETLQQERAAVRTDQSAPVPAPVADILNAAAVVAAGGGL